MNDLSLQREMLGHTIVVTLRRSDRQVNVAVTPTGGLLQQESMDVSTLLSGGMKECDVLERVLDLVAAWLEDGGGNAS